MYNVYPQQFIHKSMIGWGSKIIVLHVRHVYKNILVSHQRKTATRVCAIWCSDVNADQQFLHCVFQDPSCYSTSRTSRHPCCATPTNWRGGKYLEGVKLYFQVWFSLTVRPFFRKLPSIRLHAGCFHCCMFYFSSQQSCRVCRHKGLGTMLILCDDCNLAYHLQCLRPALSEVPEGHWSCPLCKVTKSSRSEEEYNWVLAVGDLVVCFRLCLYTRVICNLRSKTMTSLAFFQFYPGFFYNVSTKKIRGTYARKKSTKFAFENLVLVKDCFSSKFRFR